MTVPVGINDGVQIVGYFIGADLTHRGFLFSGGGFKTITAPAPDTDIQTHDINDRGQIVVDSWSGDSAALAALQE